MQAKRILLVDDSPVVHLVVRRLLQHEPYEILSARNGADGVQMAIATQPDLVLMDVVMPKMNGFEACREIRTHGDTQDIPLIMMTNRSEPYNVEQGFEAGCNDYVIKRPDGLELLAKIEALLGS